MNQQMTRDNDSRLTRLLPTSGIAFALTAFAGDLAIGPFPDENTATSKLTSFYAAHHNQVYAGGRILGYSALLCAVFGLVLWARVRRAGAHPIVAATVLVGVAVEVVSQFYNGATYALLGRIGSVRNVDPAALQAWHISGAAFGVGDATLLLAGVAAATVSAAAFPRWVGWTALVLAIGLNVPSVGFVTSMLFLLWCVATGIALTMRPSGAIVPHRAQTVPA